MSYIFAAVGRFRELSSSSWFVLAQALHMSVVVHPLLPVSARRQPSEQVHPR